MSEQQLKLFLNNVLARKNEIINTIYNDPQYKKQLRTMVKDLKITKESFKTDITVILTTVLKDSKNNGYIASVLIFSMELDTYLTEKSSWYKRSMLIETLIPILILSKHCKRVEYSCCKYLIIFFISSIVLTNLLIKS